MSKLIRSKRALDGAVSEIADLQKQAKDIKARRAAIEQRRAYLKAQSDLGDLEEEARTLQAEIDEVAGQVTRYVQKNRATLLPEGKAELTTGEIKVYNHPEKCIVEDAKALVAALEEAGSDLVTHVPKLDKTGLKRQKPDVPGYRVVRTESLDITPTGADRLRVPIPETE